LFSSMSLGNGRDAGFHFGHGVRIGDRYVADLPFDLACEAFFPGGEGVQIKLSATMFRQAGRYFQQCKARAHGFQCR